MSSSTNPTRWSHDTHIDIAATPARVWQLWSDVAGWPRWNPGVARAALQGPFASGSTFEMQLPDGGPLLHSRLLDVRPNERFTDETAFEGVLVRVTHAIVALSPPLIIEKPHVDRIVGTLTDAIRAEAA